MSASSLLIAHNIRRYRKERGMTMSALARRARLSKQTLSQIEKGVGNPTVETLALIGNALDVSLRRLLTEWGTSVLVVRHDSVEWHDHGTWRERVFDEVYGSGFVRTWLLRLDERTATAFPAPAQPPGTLHHLFVLQGGIRTGPVTDPVELVPGDFARFPADVEHYLDPLTADALAHVVTTIPQSRQLD